MSLIDTMGQDSIFQKRLAEIMAMPDGPEKQEELRQLSLDYPGMLEDLAEQREFGESMANSESPRGGVAGPASNPFSYYVAASPVEHAASGMKQYMGHKERKEAQGRIDDVRGMQQGQVQKALSAGLPPNPQMQQTQADLLRLTPEELEERRRKMMMYGGYGGGQTRA